MKYTFLFLWFIVSGIATAQTVDHKAVIETIDQFFDGLNSGDSSLMRTTLHKDARLMTTFNDQSGSPRITTSDIEQFLSRVGAPKENKWEEKLWSKTIKVEDNLAMVWTEYSFFIDDVLSHCGVNAFMLARQEDGWKIFQITDTRKKTSCHIEMENDEETIHELLNSWHRAAATADEEIFFGSMTDQSIYLGTDPSEQWTKKQFEEWAAKYFERDTAWDFTPKDRQIYFSEDGQTAWFEELLDTWMGVCRGSGVLQKKEGGWKLAHYNLAVTVLNERIEAFKKINNE